MATFRSRQRANLRRDGKREPHAAHPTEGRKPTESPAVPRTRAPAKPQDTSSRAPGKGQPPHASHRSEFPASAGERRRPERSETQTTRSNTPLAPATQPAPTTPPAARTEPSKRRRLITPVSELPEGHIPAPAPHTPTQAITAPGATPVATQPAPVSPSKPAAPRRRLITPASEIVEKPTRAISSPVQEEEEEIAPVQIPKPEPNPAPVEDSEATRRRRAAVAEHRKQYEPIQRRGLPTNDRMPTERPAFERRSAQERRRGDAPVGLAMFASCPRGLESALQQELQRMDAEDIAAVDGGVGFSGTQDLLMRVNLESRVASRVLLRLGQGPYRSERDVNALAMQIDWPHYFDVQRSIKVKTDGVGAQVKSLEYVSLTVKDAVCDRFRQAQLGRPNVDTHTPDVRIQVFLSPDSASIYLDSSGEALFKRGWRKETGEAPLRENLAAGILLLSGYNGEQALIDPMCGSGTFLVEAAEIALQRAPGRARSFAFEKWLTFDQAAWDSLKLAAQQAEKTTLTQPIQGSDLDAKLVTIAHANLARAGLDQLVTLKTQDLFEVRPNHATGLIVTNPPYGVRLDEEDTLAELYPRLGDWLKQHFAGWTANFFSGDLRLEKLIRLKMKRRIPLYNGAIECRLFVLPLIAGSARVEKPKH